MLMSGQAHLPYLAVCLHTLRNHWDGSIRVFAWPESIDIVREIAKDERLGIECELRDPAYRARRDERRQGNAVVPQVAEWIGKQIVMFENNLY